MKRNIIMEIFNELETDEIVDLVENNKEFLGMFMYGHIAFLKEMGYELGPPIGYHIGGKLKLYSEKS